jgi:hypothetical protein
MDPFGRKISLIRAIKDKKFYRSERGMQGLEASGMLAAERTLVGILEDPNCPGVD